MSWACEFGADPSRAALEYLLAEFYCADKVGKAQIRQMLGFSSWYDLEDFMQKYRLNEYSDEDLRMDLEYVRERKALSKAQAA